MTRYVLDTDHVTLHQYGNAHITQQIARHPIGDVVVTIITVEEQLRGRLNTIRQTNTAPTQVLAYTGLTATLRYFHHLPVLDFGQDAYA